MPVSIDSPISDRLWRVLLQVIFNREYYSLYKDRIDYISQITTLISAALAVIGGIFAFTNSQWVTLVTLFLIVIQTALTAKDVLN